MNKKTIYKFLIILTISLMTLFVYSNTSFAKINTSVNIGTGMRNDAAPVANKVIGIIKVIGIFVAIGMTMVVGIKYMVSSVEERAEYKKTAIAYIIGAILIFATTGVISYIYDIFN